MDPQSTAGPASFLQGPAGQVGGLLCPQGQVSLGRGSHHHSRVFPQLTEPESPVREPKSLPLPKGPGRALEAANHVALSQAQCLFWGYGTVVPSGRLAGGRGGVERAEQRAWNLWKEGPRRPRVLEME